MQLVQKHDQQLSEKGLKFIEQHETVGETRGQMGTFPNFFTKY